MSQRESLEGNVYYHQHFDAKFKIVGEMDGDYVCAWLDRNDGFRFSKHRAPHEEWELVEKN